MIHYKNILHFASLFSIAHAGTDFVKPWFCHRLDCPQFTVLSNTSDYELRHYSPSKWVATNLTVSTSYGIESNRVQFNKLFRYISGENIPGQKVEMTAPVLTTVISESSGTTYIMHFMIPHDKLVNTPVPSADDVYLVDLPSMDVYVKSFGGFAGPSTYLSNLKQLQSTLDSQSNSTIYDSTHFYTTGYDSPFAFTNRHNEVWVEAFTSS